MIRIRPALLADFDRINLDELHASFISDTLRVNSIRVYMASHSIMTAEVDGSPVFMADSKPWRDGMYIWALADVSFPEHYRDVVKLIKRWMKMLRYTTVYAHTEVSYETGKRFLEFLGFELERAGDYTTKGAVFDLYVKRAE